MLILEKAVNFLLIVVPLKHSIVFSLIFLMLFVGMVLIKDSYLYAHDSLGFKPFITRVVRKMGRYVAGITCFFGTVCHIATSYFDSKTSADTQAQKTARTKCKEEEATRRTICREQEASNRARI
jgi:hypothetical protein